VTTRDLTIRLVGPQERAAWEPLWRGYLAFYEATLSDDVIATTWTRLHDPGEPVFALGAYRDRILVGIAHYLFHRSCWSIGDNCYLQDLFVAPAARSSGAGRALIEAVERAARAAGAARLYWMTQEGNARARALYDRVARRSGFIEYDKAF
jgi:GNAT superfamily N-acetyltransferase